MPILQSDSEDYLLINLFNKYSLITYNVTGAVVLGIHQWTEQMKILLSRGPEAVTPQYQGAHRHPDVGV